MNVITLSDGTVMSEATYGVVSLLLRDIHEKSFDVLDQDSDRLFRGLVDVAYGSKTVSALERPHAIRLRELKLLNEEGENFIPEIAALIRCSFRQGGLYEPIHPLVSPQMSPAPRARNRPKPTGVASCVFLRKARQEKPFRFKLGKYVAESAADSLYQDVQTLRTQKKNLEDPLFLTNVVKWATSAESYATEMVAALQEISQKTGASYREILDISSDMLDETVIKRIMKKGREGEEVQKEAAAYASHKRLQS